MTAASSCASVAELVLFAEELLLEGVEELELDDELEILLDELPDGLEELGVDDAGEPPEQPASIEQASKADNKTAAIFLRIKKYLLESE